MFHTQFVFGQTYRTGSVVPLNCQSRGERLFGQVIHILPECEKDEVLTFVRMLSVKCFDSHYYAYVVKKEDVFDIVCLRDLADVRPVSLLSCCQGDLMYVNTRYKIL